MGEEAKEWESCIDIVEPVQDNPTAIYKLLGEYRARADITSIIGCLWALGAKATRAHYLQASACDACAMDVTHVQWM